MPWPKTTPPSKSPKDTSALSAGAGGVSGLPYLIRAGHAIITASEKVAGALDRRNLRRDPDTLDVLRDLALTLGKYSTLVIL